MFRYNQLIISKIKNNNGNTLITLHTYAHVRVRGWKREEYIHLILEVKRRVY